MKAGANIAVLLFLVLAVVLFPSQAFANKCGVNVGPYYGQVGQVRTMAKKGGWIVALGTLGDCGGYNSLFGQGLNVVLRAYNAGQPFDEGQAMAWTATLGQLDTKGQKVYFMPWNEPNQGADEGGNSTDGTAVAAYVQSLRGHLSDAGLLNTKVVLLSPMLNKTHGQFTQYLNSVGGGAAFYGLAAGSSINEYDFKADGQADYTQACLHGNPFFNNCQYDQIGIPSPYYSLEAGAIGIYDKPRYEDRHISVMLNGSWSQRWKDDSNFRMFAVFSYDPLEGGPSWDIFSAPQTKSFYQRECSAGDIDMLSGYDPTTFAAWLTANQGQLVECGSCGFAPSDRPGLCSGVGQEVPGVDLSIYDNYDADDTQFYMHPIAGLYPNRDVSVIRNDLLNQGYEARCATPGFKIGMSPGGWQYLDDFIDPVNEGYKDGKGTGFGTRPYYPSYVDGPPNDMPFRSTLTVDYRDVFTPVFRNVSGKRFLTTSLEEFFGFKDTVIQKDTVAEIRSAPINSLLTNVQRCEQSVKILLAQEKMCNKLSDPRSCPLYSRPVPQTDFTIFSLLERYYYLASHPHESIADKDLSDVHNPDTAEYVCQALIRTSADATTSWDELARIGFLSTPLTIDRAYRFAFLVTSIETKMNPLARGSMFSLYSHPNAGFIGGGPSQPKHLVLVNAFKIPDILTNNNEDGATSARSPWNDPSLLTVQSLTTSEQKQVMTEEKSDYQATLAEAANRYQTGSQNNSSEIFCLVGSGTSGVGAASCTDALSKSLVDIINGTADLNKGGDERFEYFEPGCPELIKEPATSIVDGGAFGSEDQVYGTQNPGVLFSTDFGGQLLLKLFNIPEEGVLRASNLDETHQVEPLGKSNPAFAETWREGDPRVDNPWTTLVEDWGLKTIFYVIPEMEQIGFPYNGCCDDAEVRFYLTYPVGYDMQTVQTVLAGTFMSSQQLIDLAEKEEEYDRIQLSNDNINFEGATMGKEFDNYLERCEYPIYDEFGRQIGTEMRPPCRRSFGFEIIQKGQALSAGVLGGQLGFWLREVQKSLNTRLSFAQEYLASCESTEHFLLGKCGQSLEPVPTPEPDPDCTGLSCAAQPAPPPPVAPPPEIPTCSDPSKDALEVTAFINENREWKLGIRCPSCTNVWGDIDFNAFLPDGTHYHWGPTNLGHPNGYLEMPCGGEDPCPGHGSRIPDGFTGNFCIHVIMTSNASGNQCGGTIDVTRCVTVP